MDFKRIALILVYLWLSPISSADTAFVGDNLRIGVRPEPGTQTAPTAVISSGANLEILERKEDYSRIRTEDGTIGWVRDIYLSKEPPAKLIVEQLQEKYRQAQQSLLAVQEELAASNNTNLELSQKVQLLNNEIYDLHEKLAAIRPDSHKAWIYMVVAILSLCGLAFTLGILWNKQQVAKKLGGHSL